MSCGSFSRLSAKCTGIPQLIGSSSITTRCAMCAEGRNATVRSCGPSGSTCGPISRFETMAVVRDHAPSSARRWRRRSGRESRGSDGRHLRLDSRHQPGIRGDGGAAMLARSWSSVIAPSASPESRIQCSTGAAAQQIDGLRLFHEYHARAAGFERLHQVLRGIAGIERGGDRAVGEDAEVGEVEFQPRLRIERDDFALADAQAAQARRDLLRRPPVFDSTTRISRRAAPSCVRGS